MGLDYDVRALRPSTISRRRSILCAVGHMRVSPHHNGVGGSRKIRGPYFARICWFKACPLQNLIVRWCECYNGAPGALPLIDSRAQLMLSTIRWAMHTQNSLCSPSQTFALVQEDIGRRIFPATVEGRKFLSREYADLGIVEFYPVLVVLLTRQCTTCNECNVVPRIGCCAFMRDNSYMPEPQCITLMTTCNKLNAPTRS